MREQMFSGIDTLDDTQSLMWVRGDLMAISTDEGDDDPWRQHNEHLSFKFAADEPHDPSRFTDLTLVWERDV